MHISNYIPTCVFCVSELSHIKDTSVCDIAKTTCGPVAAVQVTAVAESVHFQLGTFLYISK